MNEVPMPRTRRKPTYFCHHASGQARVRIDGKEHYLGPIDSPDSWTRYDALLEDWARRQTVDRSTLTIDELVLRFLAHAKESSTLSSITTATMQPKLPNRNARDGRLPKSIAFARHIGR